MSSLRLIKGNLASRAIRKQATGGTVRSLDLKTAITRKDDGLTNAGKLWSSFTGFLSQKIRGALSKLSAEGIWGWLVQQVERVKQFDWNASEKQLQDTMEAQSMRVLTAWGSALGRSAGWIAAIAVGAGLAYLIPVIGGSTLAKSIIAGSLKEGIPEIGAAMESAVVQTIGAGLSNFLTSGFINYRKFIKSLPIGVLKTLYGKDRGDWLKNEWGKDNGPDMSFNSGMDAIIESIEDKGLKVFLEAFLEEGWDSFIEGGIVVAQQIDTAYAQAKLSNLNTRGKRRTVRLTPDNRKKEETLILTGTQKEVELGVVEALNTYRLIGNRDVGQIVGMPAEDFVSAKPLRRQLTIVFRAKKEPPYRMPNGKPAKSVTITIPDVIVGLSWQKIKAAALKFTWGKFRATAHLDNGRQMAVYGATKGEAERTIKRLITLSTAKILSLNVTEEGEKKNINLRKDPTPMFPSNATLLVRRPTTGEDGRQFTDNTKMTADRIRIDLYMDVQPKGIPPLK